MRRMEEGKEEEKKCRQKAREVMDVCVRGVGHECKECWAENHRII